MIILQLGDFGGSQFLTFGFVVLIIAALLGYWVYTDASKRGKDNATLWGVAIAILTLLTLIGGLIAFAYYLYTR